MKINPSAVIAVSVLVFFSHLILPSGVRAQSVKIDTVSVAVIAKKIKATGLQSVTLGDFESLPYQNPSNFVLSEDVSLSALNKLSRIYIISSAQIEVSRIQDLLRDSISRISITANALEELGGRSAVIVDLPSDKVLAVAFLPPKGMRAGSFVVEFDSTTGEITNTVLGR